ncbi:MAG: 30S ribosomal protein S6 [Tissierellia bacterium]|nr:30S ribosomal protein S6 [Tissierellia bacterium]
MNNYEAVLVFKPDMEEQAREELLNRFKEVVENDGEITKIDDWGNKKLAYEIDYIKEGHYIVMDFKAQGDVIKELERRARISDYVIRYLVLKKD